MRRSFKKRMVVEETKQPVAGLPPRSQRLVKKQKERRKKYFQAGLYLFGAVAFGMVGFELSMAGNKSEPAVSYSQPVMTNVDEPNKESKTEHAVEPSKIPTTTQPPLAVAHSTETKESQSKAETRAEAKTEPKKEPKMKAKQQPPAKPEKIRHRVKAGDTLFKLSRKYYGNGMGVDRIARYNHLNPEDPLPIGRVITIPLR